MISVTGSFDPQGDSDPQVDNHCAILSFKHSFSFKIDNCYFPTKNYGSITLPLGNYDCLNIKIGNANGENWWCVMFPPLCFVDVSTGIVPDSSKQEIKENLKEEEYDLISKTNEHEIAFKFKLVELFQNWRLGLK